MLLVAVYAAVLTPPLYWDKVDSWGVGREGRYVWAIKDDKSAWGRLVWHDVSTNTDGSEPIDFGDHVIVRAMPVYSRQRSLVGWGKGIWMKSESGDITQLSDKEVNYNAYAVKVIGNDDRILLIDSSDLYEIDCRLGTCQTYVGPNLEDFLLDGDAYVQGRNLVFPSHDLVYPLGSGTTLPKKTGKLGIYDCVSDIDSNGDQVLYKSEVDWKHTEHFEWLSGKFYLTNAKSGKKTPLDLRSNERFMRCQLAMDHMLLLDSNDGEFTNIRLVKVWDYDRAVEALL